MNHSYPVDFFALGVMAYEFMTGRVLLLLSSDLILVQIEKKLEKRFLQSKSNLTKFLLMAGAERV